MIFTQAIISLNGLTATERSKEAVGYRFSSHPKTSEKSQIYIIFSLISFPRLPYSGGWAGGSPPGNFFEIWLLNREFLGHFSSIWLKARWVEGPNRRGRKSSGEGGEAKTERKENQVGKKGKGRREGNKNKRERENKAKKGREERGRDDSTEEKEK